MKRHNENKEESFSRDVTENGKTVTVHVSMIDDCEWELTLIGKANQSTTWSEWFTSSEEAMNAGLAAITREGIDEFYTIPEFSYLQEC